MKFLASHPLKSKSDRRTGTKTYLPWHTGKNHLLLRQIFKHLILYELILSKEGGAEYIP